MTSRPADPSFTRAAQAVVAGDIAGLQNLLAAEPSLVRAVSADNYNATLLHFVAANGVPNELQRTPENVLDVAKLLLDAGAVPDAIAGPPGGGDSQTTLSLLVSSWHPFERRLQAPLARLLVSHGAQPDGLQDHGTPLATALVFGYTRAAEALVDCGARVDNLYFAAGLGDLDAVAAFFDAEGKVLSIAEGTFEPVVQRQDLGEPRSVVQEAFHFAVTHGRLAVCDWLLARGAQVDGRAAGHHCELPLMQALFVHERGAACDLLRRGANPDLVDGKRGTSTRAVIERSPDEELRSLLSDR